MSKKQGGVAYATPLFLISERRLRYEKKTT